IESSPEGAEVLLNGLKVGTTPFHSDRVKSGDYGFVVKKEVCASKEIKVKVEDEKTSRYKVDLTPEFIWFSIREANQIEAGIYVDGKYKGRLPFRERLSYSPFKVEVKPDDHRYRSYSESISPAERGGTIEREIALKGIFGNVAVDSKPFLEGDIYIDGKKRGTVPDQFDLLIGEHEIVVKGVLEGKRLMGTKRVTVKEGADIELTVSMAEERGRIRVSCSPYGARVFLDGTYKGTAPLTIGDIARGEHTIKVEKEGYKAEEKLVNVEGGREASLRIDLDREKLLIETVYVAPGSFSMGSTVGGSNEKPVHSVRITRGFYISRYELTL
ncbi:MAG TPA: PEGA domain-containing protein, partial [Spirochaetales bacterium]|nr:PEGA domain-containing protein [Spirochaetales bacterium]